MLAALLVVALAAPGRAQLFGEALHHAVEDAPTSVTAADLDGDGDVDLAVGYFTSNTVSVLKNDGAGGFGPAAHYNVTGGLARKTLSLTAADVDGDRDEDVPVVLHDVGTLAIMLNDGTGTLAPDARRYVVNDTDPPTHTEFVAAVHLNRDRAIDLVVSSPERGAIPGEGVIPGHVSVLLNRGGRTGEFTLDATYASDDRLPNAVAAADLDGDGDQDLAMANLGTNDVSILLNDGGGGFDFDDDVYAIGGAPPTIAAADLDGDEDPDLVVPHAGVSDGVSIRYNDTARFFSGITYMGIAPGSVFDAPFGVAVADLDCDGALDIAVANGDRDDVAVLVNRNLGPGIPDLFVLDRHYPVGDHPFGVVAADLDADGAPDLAVASSGSDAVSVLLTEGCPLRLVRVCRAAKLAAAGRKAQGLFTCHVKGAKKGQAADPTCLAAVRDKFAAAFTKAEGRGGCLTMGDAAAIEGEVDAVVADVADDLPAVPGDEAASACAAAKRTAAATRVGGLLACHARAAKKAAVVNAACLGKVRDAFVEAFTRADAQGGCDATGDVAAIAAKLDALAVVVVSALRP